MGCHVKPHTGVALCREFGEKYLGIKDPRHNSGEAVAVGSGWAARRLFAGNSLGFAKKNNAADRPSPADHRPQGVMQRVFKALILVKVCVIYNY